MWPEWLATFFQQQQLVVAVAVAGLFLLLAVAVVAGQWRRVRLAQVETALKQQMLDKGMTVADMERVFRASAETCADDEATQRLTGDLSIDQPRLVRMLFEHSYSGDDVERLLRALHAPSLDGTAGSFSRQKAQVLAILIENGVEAEEIKRILFALEDAPVVARTTA